MLFTLVHSSFSPVFLVGCERSQHDTKPGHGPFHERPPTPLPIWCLLHVWIPERMSQHSLFEEHLMIYLKI